MFHHLKAEINVLYSDTPTVHDEDFQWSLITYVFVTYGPTECSLVGCDNHPRVGGALITCRTATLHEKALLLIWFESKFVLHGDRDSHIHKDSTATHFLAIDSIARTRTCWCRTTVRLSCTLPDHPMSIFTFVYCTTQMIRSTRLNMLKRWTHTEVIYVDDDQYFKCWTVRIFICHLKRYVIRIVCPSYFFLSLPHRTRGVSLEH